jgi:hypothetical protein
LNRTRHFERFAIVFTPPGDVAGAPIPGKYGSSGKPVEDGVVVLDMCM